jgi:hypothetical protein
VQAETDYLAGLSSIASALSGGHLVLSAAVTNWYDGKSYDIGGKSLTEAILDAGVGRLYIMNYTNTQTQMSSRASGEVGIACAYAGGAKEVISISDAKNEGSTAADQALTFNGLGWDAMDAAWSYMNTSFAASPCFKGNAGFDYNDMILLGP